MTVRRSKRARLEAAGWSFGDPRELLHLSDEEVAFIEMKLALSRKLKERRVQERLSQSDFAKRIESSQSRVAKMEAGDPSVSIDLLIRSLLALGLSREEVAASIRHAG